MPDIYMLEGGEWEDHLDAEGLWNPQCAATTKRGTQCQHRLFGGQVYTPHNGGHYISQANAAILYEGICPFHRKLRGGK